MARRQIMEMSVEDWNNKLDYFDQIDISYTIEKTNWTVSANTNGYRYKASLSADGFKGANIIQISRDFGKKTKYHYLDKEVTEEYNPYGFKVITQKLNQKRKTRVNWDFRTDCGYSYVNEKKARKWLKCWSYDINSAFSYAMLQPMPNTRVEPRWESIVQEGEMGFYKTGGATINVGDYADIIFPLMESPFKEYVYEYYELKKKAPKGSNIRDMWKDYLNLPTGIIQRHNIFLRNAIIFYSNKYIIQLMDENTVYCNVDCIVSTKERSDLPIGNEIGQFKNEYSNDNFKYLAVGIYQWNNECHYSGIKGDCLKDIEETQNWFNNCKNSLKYKYNEETRRIELNG